MAGAFARHSTLDASRCWRRDVALAQLAELAAHDLPLVVLVAAARCVVRDEGAAVADAGEALPAALRCPAVREELEWQPTMRVRVLSVVGVVLLRKGAVAEVCRPRRPHGPREVQAADEQLPTIEGLRMHRGRLGASHAPKPPPRRFTLLAAASRVAGWRLPLIRHGWELEAAPPCRVVAASTASSAFGGCPRRMQSGEGVADNDDIRFDPENGSRHEQCINEERPLCPVQGDICSKGGIGSGKRLSRRIGRGTHTGRVGSRKDCTPSSSVRPLLRHNRPRRKCPARRSSRPSTLKPRAS